MPDKWHASFRCLHCDSYHRSTPITRQPTFECSTNIIRKTIGGQVQLSGGTWVKDRLSS